jgi:hypothetical protein
MPDFIVEQYHLAFFNRLQGSNQNIASIEKLDKRKWLFPARGRGCGWQKETRTFLQ